MGNSFGWKEFDTAVEASKRQRNRVNRLRLEPNESASVRFLVNENEPYIFRQHYSKSANRYFVCAQPLVESGDAEGCVACYVAKTNGKDGPVRGAAPKYAVSVFDPRKYHRIETSKGDKKFEYEDCSEDKSCKYCKRGDEQRTNGVRHWALAETVAMQLRQFEREVLGKKCGSCGVSSVKSVRFECPECEEELDVDDPFVETRCFSCSKKDIVMVMPHEVLSCKGGCKKPRRATLADAWLEVMKSGSGTQTAYNFAVGDIEPFVIPEGLPEDSVKPVDFANEAEFQPLGVSEQCAVLGVPNPFKSVPGGTRDDDDDDPPKSKKKAVADDDDDEDEPPIFARKKARTAPADDDDEDDTPRARKKARTGGLKLRG